jgi:2'-5' RNA ligase
VTERLFIAVQPPPEVVSAIDALPHPVEPGVRWEPPGLAHVTLRYLGNADPALVAERLAAELLPSATADVGPQVSRLGRSILCLPVRGVDDLAATVWHATDGLGQPPGQHFAGHITLARLRHRAACGVAGQRFAASFEVTEVALIRSHLPTDSSPRRYECLEVFPVQRTPD